jgi:hypothetical protein
MFSWVGAISGEHKAGIALRTLNCTESETET